MTTSAAAAPEAAGPSTSRRGGRLASRFTPRGVMVVVLVTFAFLAGLVLTLTPPWEANDEPYHVQNVETIAGGHWIRIRPDGNLESIQAPLYYMVLAVWQRAMRVPVRTPDGQFGPIGDNQQHGNYLHTGPQDGKDQRWVDLLRLPSILFGLIAITLTYVAGRRLGRDRWTPVVAAAIVAGVPRFIFESGVVNNDNLSNALGAAGLALALWVQTTRTAGSRQRTLAMLGLGAIAGALMITKVTALTLTPGLALPVLLSADTRRGAVRQLGLFAAGFLLVSGWWLIQNQVWYGDPLALHAVNQHQRLTFPPALVVAGPLTRIFDQIPRDFFSSFWYDSGWNQFGWRWFWYVPFWLLTAVGNIALAWPSRTRRQRARPRWEALRRHGAIAVCVVIALGAVASVWIIGVHANTEQGRYAFMGLPAIGLLIALGYERLHAPPVIRFLLPLIGLVGTLAAIRYHVIVPYA